MKAQPLAVLIALVALASACGEPPPATPVPPTAAPTPIPPDLSFPLPGPLSLASPQQVQEARDCDLESLLAARYPTTAGVNDLVGSYAVRTACDWAVLALAYASRAGKGEPPPLEGQQALAQALVRNPALALRNAVLYSYFGTTIASAPPVAERPLARTQLTYRWFGLGDPMEVSYTLSISAADLTVSGTVSGAPYEGSAPREELAALGAALTDLIPVEKDLPALVPCTDNDTAWSVTLTYDDGTVVELTNNGSNVIGAGGPWQITLGEQRYFQFSSAFLVALTDLVARMGMPRGEPYGSYCHGLDTDLIDLLFP